MRLDNQNHLSRAKLFLGFILSLSLSACDEEGEGLTESTPPLTERPVATLYLIKPKPDNSLVPCYQGADPSSTLVTHLKSGDIVSLVAIEEGLLQRGSEFWLHVYPKLSHRPSCYVNTRSLVPYR